MFSFGLTLLTAVGVPIEVLKILEKKIIGILGCKADKDQSDFNQFKKSFKAYVGEILNEHIQKVQV